MIHESQNSESKAFLMLAFVENSAFRIGFGFGYYFLFGWISAVKRLFNVRIGFDMSSVNQRFTELTLSEQIR